MLAPLRWIQDYVKTDADVDTVAQKMIMTGNGVEGIIRLGENIKNVAVGKITEISKHPNADSLLVCKVDAGRHGTLTIVTGADNVFVGAYVPVVMHGGVLPTGQVIKKGKLRGIASEGMLCSGEELELKESDYPGAETHGILILKDEPEPGEDIRTHLSLSGSVIDFEVGANRPDCLSVIGIAREAAAALDAPLTLPETEYKEGKNNIHDIVSVQVDDQDLCSRYIARAVVDVKIGPSPAWMQQRLKEAGIRPISNIVDITNFVMLETGQPMHAFDASDIRGGRIIVRRAKDGEKMVTLDGKERVFTESMLLICDEQGPIGLAGIMGGENSEIKETTATVVFEAAKFMYGNVRQTMRALGMSTESGYRFSKGIDAATTKFAMDRALTLVQQLGAGIIAQGEIDILSEDLTPKTVKTTAAKVNALLGTSLQAEQMKEYLEKVSVRTEVRGGDLLCSIPLFRQDVAGGADIAEEVARMFGYDNIEAAPMRCAMQSGGISETERATDKIKEYMAGVGYNECVTYSFAGEADYKKLLIEMPSSVRIINPLGDDTAYMRTNMIADMLQTISVNLSKKNDRLRLIEAGRVYIPKEGEDLPDEYPMICIGQSGSGADFFGLKGCVENLSSLLCSAEASFARTDRPYYHPGICAEIRVGGELVGEMGEVHPDVCDNFDIPSKTIVAQIRIDLLIKNKKPAFKYTELPRFPAVERDLAVVVDEDAGAGDVLASIKKAGTKRLESVRLFDVYRDGKLGEGKKSLAFGLKFRAADKTMTDEETNSIMEKILRILEREFDAKLR